MTRTRERETGMGLLPRMEARPGKKATSYRYHPVNGKPIALGTNLADAIRKVLDLLGRAPDTGTVKWVWEKYKESPRFKRRADATKTDYEQSSVQILRVFGQIPIAAIDAPAVARYVRIERADAPVRANREKSLLSNLFAHGIDLGVCRENPAKHVRPNEEEPRTEAPAQATLAPFLEWVNKQSPQRRIIGLAAEFASLAGNRKVEFLDLVWPQIDTKAGLMRIKRAKQRGKKRGEVIEEIEISPALATCLEALKAIRPAECLYVFPTRKKTAYTAAGFKTLWQRIVLAAITAEVLPIGARFTFHDLRAFYATKHKATTGTLPDLHKNSATTAGIYDRSKTVKRSAV